MQLAGVALDCRVTRLFLDARCSLLLIQPDYGRPQIWRVGVTANGAGISLLYKARCNVSAGATRHNVNLRKGFDRCRFRPGDPAEVNGGHRNETRVARGRGSTVARVLVDAIRTRRRAVRRIESGVPGGSYWSCIALVTG